MWRQLSEFTINASPSAHFQGFWARYRPFAPYDGAPKTLLITVDPWGMLLIIKSLRDSSGGESCQSIIFSASAGGARSATAEAHSRSSTVITVICT
jgi:hypothetical protein